MGCTTGAKILDKGKIVFAFKNKDFPVKSHRDEISLEQPNAFGVKGVNLGTRKGCGFSIGVNQFGLIALNTDIWHTSDLPYDLITERIVLEAKTIDEAIKILEEEFSGDKRFQWGNMIVATPEELARIEITSSDYATSRSNDYLVCTNHQLLFPNVNAIITSNQKNGKKKIINSKRRHENTEEILKDVSEVKEILPLLKSHYQGGAICRHGEPTTQDLSGTTVYSYLVTIRMTKKPKILFSVIKGPPCNQGNYYTDIELEFPLTEDRRNQISKIYPF